MLQDSCSLMLRKHLVVKGVFSLIFFSLLSPPPADNDALAAIIQDMLSFSSLFVHSWNGGPTFTLLFVTAKRWEQCTTATSSNLFPFPTRFCVSFEAFLVVSLGRDAIWNFWVYIRIGSSPFFLPFFASHFQKLIWRKRNVHPL